MEEVVGGVEGWIACLQSDRDRKLTVGFWSNLHVSKLPVASFQFRFMRRFENPGGLNNQNMLDTYTKAFPFSDFCRCVIVNTEHLMFQSTRAEFVDDIISPFPMRLDDMRHVKTHLGAYISGEVQEAYDTGHTLEKCRISINYQVFVRDGDNLHTQLERHRLESLRASRMWDQFTCPTSTSIVFYGIWKPLQVHKKAAVIVWSGDVDDKDVPEQYCTVCMEKYVVGFSKVVRLPCRHVFHQTCIYTWIRVNNSCPLCRFKM